MIGTEPHRLSMAGYRDERMRRCLAFGLLATGGLGVLGAAVHAGTPDETVPDGSVPDETVPEPTLPEVVDEAGVVSGGIGGESPSVTLPVVPVPTGCAAPQLPHIVFTGTVVDSDFRSVRFEIDQIRAGQGAPFALGNEIDVRYGLDTQFLEDGERYLVSAIVDPDLGLLVSNVTDPIEHFGGDEVIGVSETDIDCPEFEDPARTLQLDGTPIDGDMLEPFFSARVQLLGAVLIPFGVAAAMIFALAALRLSVSGIFRSIIGVGRR